MMDTGPIAFYIPSLTVGGAERVTVSVANGLANRGYEVDLVVSFNNGAFREEVAEEVTVVDLGTSKIPVLGIGASVPCLSRYLSVRSPAIMFSQMTYANDIYLVSQLIARSDTVSIGTIHNTLGMQKESKEKFVQSLQRRLAAQADQFVAVSEGVAESVVENVDVDRERVTVLHNPIPVRDVQQQAQEPVNHRWLASPDHEVILGVGRLERAKNFSSFLRAFAQLHANRPQTRAIVVGRGSKRSDLEDLATDLGIEDVVSFPGFVDNPYGYMGRASVFVMSSIHEGLPTVLIEALACGCQVVSADCPSGPAEILDNGKYGRLTPVGDDAALADAIEATLKSPISADRLVERATDFAPDAVVDEYEAFVHQYVDPTTRAPAETSANSPVTF